MEGHGIDFIEKTFEPAADSASEISEADYVQMQQQSPSLVVEGTWRYSPLQLRRNMAAGTSSSFSNGLFSPNDRPWLPEACSPPCSAPLTGGTHTQEVQAVLPEGALRDAPLRALLTDLQGRVAALEAADRSHQAPVLVNESTMSPTALVSDLGGKLSDIQQTCHDEQSSEPLIGIRLVQLRQLLHERADQGLRSSAGSTGSADEEVLRTEMAYLADCLVSEMLEVREFVKTETSDICAFVEERIDEAVGTSQWQSQLQEQSLPCRHSSEREPGSSQLAIAASPNSQCGAGSWSPTSTGASSSLAVAELPRNMQELWHCMQRGMQRVEGLRVHTEEHLAAVRSLCAFADDRITDINQLHDRFEERIEDLHASQGEQERKLVRLHSEQARSAGAVLALSAVTAGLPQAQAATTFVGKSPACLTRTHNAAYNVHTAVAWTGRLCMDMGVMLAIAALLAVAALNNEPGLKAT